MIEIRKLAAVDMVWLGPRIVVGEYGLGVVGPLGLGVLSCARAFRHWPAVSPIDFAIAFELLRICQLRPAVPARAVAGARTAIRYRGSPRASP
jgi:hypothetical protein